MPCSNSIVKEDNLSHSTFVELNVFELDFTIGFLFSSVEFQLDYLEKYSPKNGKDAD